MDRMITRAAPYLYAVLRIIGALLYACHGAQKLLGLFGGVRGGTVPLMSLLGVAAANRATGCFTPMSTFADLTRYPAL